MKNYLSIFLIVFFAIANTYGQKVGLVLSGGGARGITHIGVIKALEENNIPIDYIAGTSMGAIVGSMYAMGMNTDEMIAVLKSEEFKYWSTGEIPPKYKYYYRQPDLKPALVEMPFTLSGKIDSIQFKARFLPTNLIPSHQMNYAFIPLFAQANALCEGDFNKLFVPFRCVASDIYKKQSVIFRRGVLGDAVRASMTFPFVFKPITINGRLLFDGGIYNNFPVGILKQDFMPEYIIGSMVVENPEKPTDSDVYSQLQSMIMNQTNYYIDPKEGILFDFKLDDISLFDFSPVDKLVKIGYDSTIARIQTIKEKVTRLSNPAELQAQRDSFKQRLPELKFQNILVRGVDSTQRKYITKVFHNSNNEFSLSSMKENYFKLISDDKILEVVPHAIQNSSKSNFDLILDVKTQDQLKFLLGGNVSSSTSNEAYFGVRYQNLSTYSQSAWIDAQFGRVYNGLGAGIRIDPPTQHDAFLKLTGIIHRFDYFEGDQVFYSDNRLSSYSQSESYLKFSAGLPIKMKGRFEFGIGYGAINDYYAQSTDTITLMANRDHSAYNLGSLFFNIESNSFDNYMYPRYGYSYFGGIQLVGGDERFKSVKNSSQNTTSKFEYWLQVKAKFDRYMKLSKSFNLGITGEGVYSTRELQNNYTASIIQAPVFTPTPHSKSIANAAISANQYLAVGIKPIVIFNPQLHFRTEAYCFVPYKTILADNMNKPYYSEPLKSARFLTEIALVLDIKIASASLFGNYYSAGPSRWNAGVNIGFLLFNKKFLE